MTEFEIFCFTTHVHLRRGQTTFVAIVTGIITYETGADCIFIVRVTKKTTKTCCVSQTIYVSQQYITIQEKLSECVTCKRKTM